MKKSTVYSLTAGMFLSSSVAWAASPMDAFFSPGNTAAYTLQYEPTQDGSPYVLNQQVRGSAKVAQTDKRSWTLTGGAARFRLGDPVAIPQSTVVFPESLGSIDGGVSYLRQFGERRQWGGSLSVGSASDHVFNSLYETEVQVTGSYMMPSRHQNAWLMLLNYSNNRTFLNNIPVPGLAYMWLRPAQGLQVVVGFPLFLLNYQSPKSGWSGRASVIGPTNISAEIGRLIRGPFRAYTAFQRNPEQWMRAGRNDHSNRLIYDEKKALLGVRGEFAGAFTVDLSGGRSFDRRLFEARDASRTGAPRVNLNNGWIVGLQLNKRFSKL